MKKTTAVFGKTNFFLEVLVSFYNGPPLFAILITNHNSSRLQTRMDLYKYIKFLALFASNTLIIYKSMFTWKH